MKRLTVSLFGLLLLVAFSLSAQTTMSSTTFAAAVSETDQFVTVASATGITAPSGNVTTTLLFSGREAMRVITVSGTKIGVLRGQDGTPIQGHASGAVVWLGAPSAFANSAPVGTCTAALTGYAPRVVVSTGDVYDCPTSGAWSGVWVRRTLADPVRVSDRVLMVSPQNCTSYVSGNSTGTNGQTYAQGTGQPVVQAQTSVTGTNSHTYFCTIPAISRTTSGKGIEIVDVVFLYGVQTSALGTQVATLASGTMNSAQVFSLTTYPTAAASETQSAAPARGDSGTLTITPVVASFNTGTTTSGQYFSVKFTPASPIRLDSDLKHLFLTITLQCAATSATITNSPGLLVHYNEVL